MTPSRRLPALLAAATVLPGALHAQATDTKACVPSDQLSCACDANAGVNSVVKPCFIGDVFRDTQTSLDPYAANMFAAVMWPAKSRAVPDYGITTPSDAGASFETVLDGWRSTRDVFQLSGAAPVPWDSSETAPLPEACARLDIAAEKAKYGDRGAAIPDRLPPRYLDEYVNPQGHALIDASGRPARFEVAFNRQALGYVTENDLWQAAALGEYLDKHGALDLPAGSWNAGGQGSTVERRRGAIVAKMAWKILDPNDDPDWSVFHTSWAYVTPVIENGQRTHGCALMPVGLVGLHLSAKLGSLGAASEGRDSDWLWASFVHTGVAPAFEDVGRASMGWVAGGLQSWLYYDPASAALVNRPPRSALARLASQIVREYPSGYYAAPQPPRALIVTDAGGQSAPAACNASNPTYPCSDPELKEKLAGTPFADFHVIRQQGADCSSSSRDFSCINQELRAGFAGTAMEHYELLGSQWMQKIAGQSQGALFPAVLGNPTLESYTQNDASCGACHASATAGDGFQPAHTLDSIFSFYNDVLARSAPGQAK